MERTNTFLSFSEAKVIIVFLFTFISKIIHVKDIIIYLLTRRIIYEQISDSLQVILANHQVTSGRGRKFLSTDSAHF